METALRTVLGGGINISKTNPLPYLLDSDKGIVNEIAWHDLLDRYWYKRANSSQSITTPISKFWANGKFEKPQGQPLPNLIYTRLAYEYPIYIGTIKWNSLVGFSGAPLHHFQLENGCRGATFFCGFRHRLSDGVDKLYATIGHSTYDITSLAPADWTTAPHTYTVLKIINGCELYIDAALRVVAAFAPGVENNIEIINNYAYIRVGSGVERKAWASFGQAMVGIEDAATNENPYFEIDPESVYVDSTDGKLSRLYYVLSETTLNASTLTALSSCAPIFACTTDKFALTVRCTYNAAARSGIKVHLYTSNDGLNYDTVDWDSWLVSFTADQTVQQTKIYGVGPRFVKVRIENLDTANAVTNVSVQATLGGA